MTRYLLPLLPLTLLACGDPEPELPEEFTVMTYNGGLAEGFVNSATYRTPLVAEAVAASNADLICLQEIWSPEAIATMETSTSAAFPHQFYPAPQPDPLPEAACSSSDLDNLTQCVEDNCSDVCSEEIDDCLLANCVIPFIRAEPSCQGCVMATIGGTVEEVEAQCSEESVQYAYGGAFGTGFVSKVPMAEVEEYVFSSTTNRRSVLHTVVDGPTGPMDVYCTHLTAIFSTLPYPRESGTWAEEQLEQIEALLEYVESSAQTDTQVLLGDFNTGPEGKYVAEYPEHYQKFIDDGYLNPYVEEEKPCTYCSGNPLNGGDGSGGAAIDHVFFKGFAGDLIAPKRTFTETLDEMPYCDTSIEGALSDHFGVEVTMRRATE